MKQQVLDEENEDLIINQINKFRKNKIIIIVSHKYNSVKFVIEFIN